MVSELMDGVRDAVIDCQVSGDSESSIRAPH